MRLIPIGLALSVSALSTYMLEVHANSLNECKATTVTVQGCTFKIETLIKLGNTETIKGQLSTAFNNRGRAYSDNREHDLAIADFVQAIKLNANNGAAYNNRGLAYYHKGDYDRAILDFNQSLKLKLDAAPINNRGLAYVYSGDYDRAITDFDEAIRLKPDFATAFDNRGYAYVEKGEYDRAIISFDQAIKLKPDFAQAFHHRGHAFLKKGEQDRAISDFTQAIKLQPDLTPAFQFRATAYVNKGDYDRAIADFDAAIRLKPDYMAAIEGRRQAVVARSAKASPSPAHAPPLRTGLAGTRLALVIGNGDYVAMGPLRNPHNDAAAVSKVLLSIGFSVETLLDADRASFVKTLRSFSEKAGAADVALVYYSGHAVQIPRGAAAENYLLPVDAKLSDAQDADDEAVSLSRVLERISRAKARVVILDACRDNPFAARIATASRAVPTRGLARMEAADHGSLIVYSTAPNTVAADGDGELSPFTKAFVDNIPKRQELRTVFTDVRLQVNNATGGKQRPYSEDGLLQSVYLAGQ